jgi:hypothetical protein
MESPLYQQQQGGNVEMVNKLVCVTVLEKLILQFIGLKYLTNYYFSVFTGPFLTATEISDLFSSWGLAFCFLALKKIIPTIKIKVGAPSQERSFVFFMIIFI